MAEESQKEPTLEDLFHPPDRGAPLPTATSPGFPAQNEQVQRAIQAQRQALLTQFGNINWDRVDERWESVDGDVVEIYTMSDKRLGDVVCWAITNRRTLFEAVRRQINGPDDPCLFLNAETWLRSRPLFVSLIVETARRKLTLPVAIFRFVETVVLPFLETGGGGVVQLQQEPYRDERLLPLQDAVLTKIAGLSTQNAYGQMSRRLDLD